MILILIALIAAAALGVVCALYFDTLIAEVGGAMITTFASVGLLLFPIVAWEYIAAGYKQEIVNAEFQTEYTQAQIFYASDVIDEIRELKRQRVEVNAAIYPVENNEKLK